MLLTLKSRKILAEFHSPPALLFAVGIALCVHLAAVLLRITPVLSGDLWDPDTYLYLTRAARLMHGGPWYEEFFPRINAPYGTEIHFSRLYEFILLAGAIPGSWFFGFDRALWWWGILVSPLMHITALITLSWGTRPFFSNRTFVVMALLASTQRPIVDPFLAGRPDHHALLLLLMTGVIACLLRAGSIKPSVKPSARPMAAAGVLSGLAIWTVVEGMWVVLLGLLVCGLTWVGRGQRYGRELATFGLLAAITTTLSLMIQVSPALWTTPSYFRISSVHVVLLWVILVALLTLITLDHRRFLRTPFHRLGAGIIAGGLIGALISLLFPEFFSGPIESIDPFVRSVLMDPISETLSSVPTDAPSTFRFVLNISPLLFCFPFVLNRLFRGPQTERWLHFVALIGLLVLTPYALLMMRGTAFFQLVLILPWALVIQATLKKKVLGWIGAGFLAFGNLALGAWVAQGAHLNVEWQVQRQCRLEHLVPYLQTLPEAQSNGILLSDSINDGSELIYRTSYSVVGAPYHENVTGIRDTHLIFGSAEDDQEARAVLEKRKVGLVLLCRVLTPPQMQTIENIPVILYSRLYRGLHPDWLVPLELPENLASEFLLFRVHAQR